jgi:hypothetical protein
MKALVLAALVPLLSACEPSPVQPLPLMGFAAGAANVEAPKPAAKKAPAVSLSGVAYGTGTIR